MGRIGGMDGGDRFVQAAHAVDGDHRDDKQRGKHQQSLGDIGQRSTQKATKQRIGQGNPGHQQHAEQVVGIEGSFEEYPAGDHAGGNVEGKEHQDDEAGGDAQQVGVVLETALQKARQGDRVVGYLGVGT